LLSALIIAIILGLTLFPITDKSRLLKLDFYTENPVWCTLGVAFGSVALVFFSLVYYGVVPFNSGKSPYSVVASFDSVSVTQEELDRKLGTQLTQLNRRIYDQQYQMLESILLDYDAKKQGVTTSQLTKKIKRTTPPITDTQVKGFFNQNQDKMNGKSYNEMKPRIRQYLEGKASAEAIGEYVSFLKKKYTFRQFLPRLFNVKVIPNPHQKMTVGPDNAKLKVVVFSDFECPYCKRAHDELKALYNQYPKDIQLTFRHLPLSRHSGSYMKAIAAVCADQQGKTLKYSDLVFGNMNPQSNEKLVNYARKINLNIPEFEYCLNGDGAKQVIQSDMDEVNRLSINATPALFFNGEFYGMVPNGPNLNQLLKDYGIIK
jgi:protein-disulfide isomerase